MWFALIKRKSTSTSLYWKQIVQISNISFSFHVLNSEVPTLWGGNTDYQNWSEKIHAIHFSTSCAKLVQRNRNTYLQIILQCSAKCCAITYPWDLSQKPWPEPPSRLSAAPAASAWRPRHPGRRKVLWCTCSKPGGKQWQHGIPGEAFYKRQVSEVSEWWSLTAFLR